MTQLTITDCLHQAGNMLLQQTSIGEATRCSSNGDNCHEDWQADTMLPQLKQRDNCHEDWQADTMLPQLACTEMV